MSGERVFLVIFDRSDSVFISVACPHLWGDAFINVPPALINGPMVKLHFLTPPPPPRPRPHNPLPLSTPPPPLLRLISADDTGGVGGRGLPGSNNATTVGKAEEERLSTGSRVPFERENP